MLSCLQKMKVCYWVEGKGLYKMFRGELLTLSQGWQVLNGSSDSSSHLPACTCLIHASSAVLKELSQLSLLTMLWFILLSHQGVILYETEINAPRRYHGCLWAFRLELVQHNLSSLHMRWVRYVMNTSSFGLLICSC